MDKLIKEAVKEMVESINPPPVEESWERLKKKLEKKQSKTKPWNKKRS